MGKYEQAIIQVTGVTAALSQKAIIHAKRANIKCNILAFGAGLMFGMMLDMNKRLDKLEKKAQEEVFTYDDLK